MTTTELVPTNGAALAPVVTNAQLDVVRNTIAKDATPAELQLYLYDCARQGVHPLDRLLHFTKRSGRYTPVTSIDLMRARAAETGDHAGTDNPYFEGTPETDDFTATVTVYRLVQGQRCAWSATARWAEYKPSGGDSGNGDRMWKKMPYLMLGKCAEALALRKAFPRQLSGVYTPEEMAQSERPAQQSQASYNPPADTPRTMTGAASDKQINMIKGVTRRWEWSDEETIVWINQMGIAITEFGQLTKQQASDVISALKKLESETNEPAANVA